MDNPVITFNEIDFILPSYRYNIQFSYVTKQGLSFIREYILRLVQLGAISPNHIASYFGLNEREAKEAISDLIKREELRYNDQDQIELTEKSQGYFESLGSSLNVSELKSTGTNLGFELTSLTCVSSKGNRSERIWTQGFRIDVASSKIANRDRLVSKAFQRHFQDLIEDGYMSHVKDNEGGKPNIYKVESLNQIGSDPYRIKLPFQMDIDGNATELDDIESLKDSSEALELVASVINEHSSRNNHREILDAIEAFQDPFTSKLFSTTNVKIDEFIHLKSSDASNKGRHIPFIGSLYSDENWKTFSELLEKEKKRLVSQHQDGIADLKWLIPSNAFWGKNDRVRSCLAEISNGIKTTGKKSKTLYDFKVMAPLSSADDHREKKNWFHDLKIVEDHLHGYIDGYLGDAVEVVMLEDRLVAVTYYLNIPESYRVPVPIGFISTDKGVISSIAHSLNGYLSESHGDSRKNLGKLYKS
jgi:predicted transcriptional regulator